MFGPHASPGRPRPEDVAHRADDVRLNLAQARAPGERRVVALGEPAPHRVDALSSSQRPSATASPADSADEAGRSGDPVVKHVRSEATGLCGRPRPAVERRREPALGVRERHVHVLAARARSRRPLPSGSVSSYAPSEIVQRPDHGDGNHRDARERLLRPRSRGSGPRGDVAVERRAPPGAARSNRASFLRGQRRPTRDRSSGNARFSSPREHSGVTSGRWPRRLMDGKALAERIRAEVSPRSRRSATSGWRPCSSATTPPPHIYVRHKHKAAPRPGIDERRPPPAGRRDRRTSCSTLLERAERRRRGRRHPRPAAAAGAHRRGRGDRAPSTRRRTSTASTRSTPACSTSAEPALRAGDAGRDHGAARRVRRRARGRARRRRRPQPRSSASRSRMLLLPAQRDRDDLPLAHADLGRADARGRRPRRRRRPGRTSITADMVKPGAAVDRRRHQPHRRGARRRRRSGRRRGRRAD